MFKDLSVQETFKPKVKWRWVFHTICLKQLISGHQLKENSPQSAKNSFLQLVNGKRRIIVIEDYECPNSRYGSQMCGDGGNVKKCTALFEAMSKDCVAQLLSIAVFFNSDLYCDQKRQGGEQDRDKGQKLETVLVNIQFCFSPTL